LSSSLKFTAALLQKLSENSGVVRMANKPFHHRYTKNQWQCSVYLEKQFMPTFL